MDQAIVLSKGTPITAQEVADQRELVDEGAYRGDLACPGGTCRAVTHFRSKAKNGKRAHFYASHNDVCDWRGRTVESEEGSIDPFERPRANDGEHIFLTLAHHRAGTGGEVHADGTAVGESGRQGTGASPGTPERRDRKTHVLKMLLKNLILNPDYVTEGVVYLSAGKQVPVVEFDDVNTMDDWVQDGHDAVVWGRVAEANEGSYQAFLNQAKHGDDNKAAIVLSPTEAAELVEHEPKVKTFTDLSGLHVIAYGRGELMSQGGKVRINAVAGDIAFQP